MTLTSRTGPGEIIITEDRESHLNVEAVAQVRAVTPGTEDLNVEAVTLSASGGSRDGRREHDLGRTITGGPEHVQVALAKSRTGSSRTGPR